MTTTVYLDRTFSFKKEDGTNYVKTDTLVVMIGIQYQSEDGINYISLLDDNSEAASADVYQFPIKRFVQLNNGSYKFDCNPYIYKMSSKRFIYDVTDMSNPLSANFGKFYKTNINNEFEYQGSDIPEGTINEIDFFINAIGKCIYPSPFTIQIWDAYLRLLNNVYLMGVI